MSSTVTIKRNGVDVTIAIGPEARARRDAQRELAARLHEEAMQDLRATINQCSAIREGRLRVVNRGGLMELV